MNFHKCATEFFHTSLVGIAYEEDKQKLDSDMIRLKNSINNTILRLLIYLL